VVVHRSALVNPRALRTSQCRELRALETPIRQIAENSGVEGSIVINKVLESKSDSFGFDAQAEELQGSRNGRDH
jgi:hypothetical protein